MAGTVTAWPRSSMHPDVQRSLMTMKALTAAARAIAYNCAHAIDMSEGGENQQYWDDRAALLTPIAKAFSTDIGCEVASIGVQVHGGMGYVEETGAAQLMRDARIAPIYEGTNGIQAIDLVTRKLPLSGGDAISGYIAELRNIADEVTRSNRDEFAGIAEPLTAALDDMEAATAFLLKSMEDGDRQTALAGASPYLRLFGLASGGAYLAKSALSSSDADLAGRATIARFAAGNLLGETASLRRTIESGAESLLAAGELLIAS